MPWFLVEFASLAVDQHSMSGSDVQELVENEIKVGAVSIEEAARKVSTSHPERNVSRITRISDGEEK